MDGTADAFRQIARTHARFGTTSMVPTTLTTTQQRSEETLASYEAVKDKPIDGAQFLGIHLEGPYFAMSQRGAQDQRYISNRHHKECMPILEKYDSSVRWSAAAVSEGELGS